MPNEITPSADDEQKDLFVRMAAHFSGLSEKTCREMLEKGWSFVRTFQSPNRWEAPSPIKINIQRVSEQIRFNWAEYLVSVDRNEFPNLVSLDSYTSPPLLRGFCESKHGEDASST